MGDSDIEQEVDQILQEMHNKKDPLNSEMSTPEVPLKVKKPRKPRTISEKQKKSLEEGRKRRQLEVEIRRLEKQKRGGEAVKKLEQLRKEKDEKTKKEEKEEKEYLQDLKRQIDELKQQVGKSQAQPIINVHAPPPPDKQRTDEQFKMQLQRYIKY